MKSNDGCNFPPTRASLLAGMAGEGDGANGPCKTFFSIYGPIVHRFARRAGLAEPDADEVLSRVMENFWKRVRRGGFKVDSAKGRFRDYIRKIANHEISRARRRQGRSPLDLEAAGTIEDVRAAALPEWAEIEDEERLRACLDRLRGLPKISPRDVSVFESYALEGEAADAVAKRYGVSKSRVFAIKHEMIQRLRRLRTQLDGHLGEV
jgi:RNA polymerase sigma factor (sigma-70 family)